jgi:hypothetical protein
LTCARWVFSPTTRAKANRIKVMMMRIPSTKLKILKNLLSCALTMIFRKAPKRSTREYIRCSGSTQISLRTRPCAVHSRCYEYATMGRAVEGALHDEAITASVVARRLAGFVSQERVRRSTSGHKSVDPSVKHRPRGSVSSTHQRVGELGRGRALLCRVAA